MNNGIYSVSFQTPTGAAGAGLVVVLDGAVHGGDAGFVYRGRFEIGAGQLRGKLAVTRWSAAVESVFGPINHFDLQVSGSTSGDAFSVSAVIPQAPDRQMVITGQRVADLIA